MAEYKPARIPAEVWFYLKERSYKEHKPMTELLRELVRHYEENNRE